MSDHALVRCTWATNAELTRYHDTEWGVPVHDDRLLFEFLILEGAQAGLSWNTILQKREAFRAAFDHFDATSIAKYNSRKIQRLLQNADIIRNRLKIHSAINNAQAYLEIQEEWGSFDHYVWQFVNGMPIKNRWKTSKEVPCHTAESDAMAKDLKQRGFSFVGTTICYAFMQAIGMVNDHTTDCFRHRPIHNLTPTSM